jgi:hypothetical protein
MILSDIEKYFADPNKLQELIVICSQDFDRIAHYETLLAEGAIDNPGEIDKAMHELVSIFSRLNVISRIAESYKNRVEAQEYFAERIKLENQGSKPTEKHLDLHARRQAEPYRRIVAIFEGYRDSSDRMISVLQSSLKSMERERHATT